MYHRSVKKSAEKCIIFRYAGRAACAPSVFYEIIPSYNIYDPITLKFSKSFLQTL